MTGGVADVAAGGGGGVRVRLMSLVRAVWLSCQASVVLVMLMVACWRLVPVVVLRW